MFVEGREQDGVEVDRPKPVVGFLQADVLVDHRIREVHQAAAESKGPARSDLLHKEVAMILERRQSRGRRPRRRRVVRAGCFLIGLPP